MTPLASAAAVVASIGVITGATFAVDERYASRSDLTTLAMDFKRHSLLTHLRSLQQRLWSLQDRYGDDCGTRKTSVAAWSLKFYW